MLTIARYLLVILICGITMPALTGAEIQVQSGYKAEVFVSGLDVPVNATFNDKDELFVVESGKYRILKITMDGGVSVFVKSAPGAPLDFRSWYLPPFPTKMDFDSNGDLYVGVVGGYGDPYNPYGDILDTVYRITPDGNVYTISRQWFGTNKFYDITGLTFGPDGHLYIGDPSMRDILKVNLTTNTSTKVGDIIYPLDLLFDRQGNLLVAGFFYGDALKIWSFAPDGAGTVYSNAFLAPRAIAWGPEGYLYILDSATKAVYTLDTETNEINTFASGFYDPYDIELDSQGNLYVVEPCMDDWVPRFNPIPACFGQIIKISKEEVPFSNVRLIDTIPNKDVEFVLSSAIKVPYSVTTEGDKTIVEWRFDSFNIGQNQSISFDLNLYNLIPGENRLVDHKLELIYTDKNGKETIVALPELYVNVLNSALGSTISTDKPIYQTNEDVHIDVSITNFSEYAGPIDARVLIEDNTGVPVKEIVNLSNLNFNALVAAPTVAPVMSFATSQTIALFGTKPANTSIVINEVEVIPLDGSTTWQGSYTLQVGTNILSVNARNAFGYDSDPVVISVAFTGAPVALWHMDGNWQDSSGNGNYGTASNGAGFSPDSKMGSHAGALDGIDDYVQISPAPNVTANNSFSVEAWVKPINTSYGRIMSQFDNYYLYYDNGLLKFTVKNSLGTSSVVSTTADNSGNWVHLVGVYSGSDLKLYVNGSKRSSIIFNGTLPSSSNPLYIGKFLSPGRSETEKIYNNWNALGVASGATRSENWAITEAKLITFLYIYHWNGGYGAPAANISIRRSSDNAVVWQGLSTAGTGHAAYPNIVLPPGTYYCTDDAAAWSYTAGSDRGFLRVDGKPAIDQYYNGLIDEVAIYNRALSSAEVQEHYQMAVATQTTTHSGITKRFDNLIFNTGATYAGNYRAKLILYENQKQVGEASANFTILPTKVVDSKIVTDKAAVKVGEQTSITSTIRSASPNFIFENLVARVTVASSQGQTLFTDEKPIQILAPGQLVELKTYWNTATNPKGSYTVKLEVLEGAAILSTSLATLEILGSKDTGDGLIGTITASPNPVYQGRDETITYTVTNKGNEDLSSLNVKVLIVNPDTQEIKNTFESTINLSMNTTATGNFVFSTSNLTPRVYLAILQARTSTMPEPKTLASTTFEVKPSLEVTKTIPDVKNVLVWLNYPWQSMQNCPDRTLIEQALKEAGVNYHIVPDKKDFDAELRNPYYTDFFILGDHNPIEDHFSEELREQVYSGKGLISSLFNRQNLDAEVFGIKFNGYLSGRDYPVNLLQSRISEAGILQPYGRALNIEAINLSENIGWISETSKKGITDHPAAIKRSYGNGNVLFFAFDLGLSIQNYDQFATLLKNSLNYIHKPLNTDAFYPNQLIPVEIKIKSLGGVFDLRITETYAEGIRVYDPLSGKWITDNPWVINMNLEPNDTKTILYYALTPDTAGTFTLQTEVGYMDNGTYNFYQNLSTDIVVAKDTITMTGDIITALKSLSISGQDKAKVDNAISRIEDVQNSTIHTDIDIEQNIHDIIQAIDSLLFITSADISNIRLMMDELLCVWEDRFYFNMFTQ